MVKTIKNLFSKLKDFILNLLSFGCYKVWYVDKEGKVLAENIIYGTRKSVKEKSEIYSKIVPGCQDILYLDCTSNQKQNFNS